MCVRTHNLQHILIHCFQHAFEKNEGEKLIGGPLSPDQDNHENIISAFITKIIDPENPFGTSDSVRILLLQLSSLLVEQASSHIHDAKNKKQDNKLRWLLTFAWPCLLSKNCVDPATKYHGHLLLSHIIAIHKRIVLQFFRKQGNKLRRLMTFSWPCLLSKNCVDPATKYHDHLLLSHIIAKFAIHKRIVLQATIQHRKLAVDLADVVIKWEVQRVKDDQETTKPAPNLTQAQPQNVPTKHPAPGTPLSVDSPQESKRSRHSSRASSEEIWMLTAPSPSA
uniref:Transformation/transcription domain-associated protein-like n=1 Tax=Crassostrea virginica TaxID=6565 RepID=A0A8B8BVV8_CRAVI|nr:transformation/transcription domain-associated protein-like [Crassostrea virginica]